MYRHGDILLKLARVPESAGQKEKCSEVTIALGEATGHHHTLYGSLPIELLEWDGHRYLRIQEAVELRHQEHHTLQIDPGEYEITNEREYDYFEESMKKVVD